MQRTYLLLYIDPGSGMLLWQILAASMVGVLFRIRSILFRPLRNAPENTRRRVKQVLSFAGAILGLYCVPTLIELMLAPHAGPWVSYILFGNLLGCGFLFFWLDMRKTAVLVYVVATSLDIVLLAVGKPASVAWISDLIPATISAFLVSSHFDGQLTLDQPVGTR